MFLLRTRSRVRKAQIDLDMRSARSRSFIKLHKSEVKVTLVLAENMLLKKSSSGGGERDV